MKEGKEEGRDTALRLSCNLAEPRVLPRILDPDSGPMGGG